MAISEANVNTFIAALVALFESFGRTTTSKTQSPDQTWSVSLTVESRLAPASVRAVGSRLVVHLPLPIMEVGGVPPGWSSSGDASVALPAGCDPNLVHAHSEVGMGPWIAGEHDRPIFKLAVDLAPRRRAVRHGQAVG